MILNRTARQYTVVRKSAMAVDLNRWLLECWLPRRPKTPWKFRLVRSKHVFWLPLTSHRTDYYHWSVFGKSYDKF